MASMLVAGLCRSFEGVGTKSELGAEVVSCGIYEIASLP